MLKAFSRGTANPPWLPKKISNSFSELQPFYHLSAKVRRRAFLPLPKRYSLLSLNTEGLILFSEFQIVVCSLSPTVFNGSRAVQQWAVLFR